MNTYSNNSDNYRELTVLGTVLSVLSASSHLKVKMSRVWALPLHSAQAWSTPELADPITAHLARPLYFSIL